MRARACLHCAPHTHPTTTGSRALPGTLEARARAPLAHRAAPFHPLEPLPCQPLEPLPRWWWLYGFPCAYRACPARGQLRRGARRRAKRAAGIAGSVSLDSSRRGPLVRGAPGQAGAGGTAAAAAGSVGAAAGAEA